MEVVKIWIEHYERSKCCDAPLIGRKYRSTLGLHDVYSCSHCKKEV